jgi:hypothetical protein
MDRAVPVSTDEIGAKPQDALALSTLPPLVAYGQDRRLPDAKSPRKRRRSAKRDWRHTAAIARSGAPLIGA